MAHQQAIAVVAGLGFAAVLAVVYSFSPMTVICVGAMLLLLRYAGRGLSGRERTWVLSAASIALAARLGALVAVYVASDPLREDFHALFGDGRFAIQRSLWILNDWSGATIGPLYRLGIFYPYGNVTVDRGLAVLQWFVGPSPYAITLISLVSFFAAAVLLHRTARSSFGPAAATAGFVVLLFWPTYVAWSISMLKESLHLLVVAVAVASTARAFRAEGLKQRLAFLAIGAAAVLLASPLRTAGQWIVLAGILTGFLAVAATRRPASVAVLSAVVIALGISVVRQPSAQSRIQLAVSDAVHYHVGQVASPGKSYRAADRYFYDEWPDRPLVTLDEGGRFLLRSAAMFVVAPLPSHVVSATEMLFLPQHFAWFLLVLLACVGATVGILRDPLFTGICVGYSAAALVVIGPTSGNIGTLVRHRDMIVPFVVWLSGLGALDVVARLRVDRHAAH